MYIFYVFFSPEKWDNDSHQKKGKHVLWSVFIHPSKWSAVAKAFMLQFFRTPFSFEPHRSVKLCTIAWIEFHLCILLCRPWPDSKDTAALQFCKTGRCFLFSKPLETFTIDNPECVSVCLFLANDSSETIKVIIKLGTVTVVSEKWEYIMCSLYWLWPSFKGTHREIVKSPIYDLCGWQGVKNQLSIYLIMKIINVWLLQKLF